MTTNQEMHELGNMLYGECWPQIARYNAEYLSENQTMDIDRLTEAQQKRLVDGMKKLNAKRNAVLRRA